jgi:WD40 repeat protein
MDNKEGMPPTRLIEEQNYTEATHDEPPQLGTPSTIINYLLFLLDTPFRWLFGRDVFISYSRKDGITYAEYLAGELRKSGLTYYLDIYETIPAKKLPRRLRLALWRSTLLVVIGTHGAARSKNVLKEVTAFSQIKRPVIPVIIGKALSRALWRPLIVGSVMFPEENVTQDSGILSPQAISRINKSFGAIRQEKRLRIASGGAALLIVLSLVGVIMSLRIMANANARAYNASVNANNAGMRAENANKRASESEGVAYNANVNANNAIARATNANARAENANARAEQANSRAENANYRAAKADVRANQADNRAINANIKADDADKRRNLAERQEKRSSIIAQARGAMATNPLRAYLLSKEAISLGVEAPEIGESNAAKLLLTQAVNQGLPIVYPFFKQVVRVRFQPGGNYIAAIGTTSSSSREQPNELRIWSKDGKEQYAVKGDFQTMEFSPDGSFILAAATVKRKLELQWYSLKLQQLRSPTRFPDIKNNQATYFTTYSPGRIKEISFTKNGDRILIAGLAYPSVYPFFWTAWIDVSSPTEVKGNVDFAHEQERINPLQAVARQVGGGDNLVSRGYSEIYLDDMRTSRRTTIGSHSAYINGLDVSPSGEKIAVVGEDNKLTLIWKSGSGWTQTSYVLPGEDECRMIKFISESEVAVARDDFSITLFPIQNQKGRDKTRPTLLRGHAAEITALELSPDGTRLATASEDGTTRVWNLFENDNRVFQGAELSYSDIQFDRDGHWLISGNMDGAVRLWNTEDSNRFSLPNNPEARIRETFESIDPRPDRECSTTTYSLPGQSDNTSDIRWSPDGKYFAAMNNNGIISLWSKDYKFIRKIETEQSPLAFSGDSKWLIGRSIRRRRNSLDIEYPPRGVDMWEVNGNREINVDTKTGVTYPLFMSTGETFISSKGDWAEITTENRLALHKVEDGVDGNKLAFGIFSPDANWFAVIKDKKILLWQTSNLATEPKVLTTYSALAVSDKVAFELEMWMEFSPQSNYLAVLAGDEKNHTIEVFSLPDLNHVNLSPQRIKPFHALSPDGKLIAASGCDGELYIWPTGGGEAKTLNSHSLLIRHLSFSPDSKWIATGGQDRVLRLWAVETGDFQEIKLLNSIEEVVFDPNGTKVLAASGEAIKVWFAPIAPINKVLDELRAITNATYSVKSGNIEYGTK